MGNTTLSKPKAFSMDIFHTPKSPERKRYKKESDLTRFQEHGLKFVLDEKRKIAKKITEILCQGVLVYDAESVKLSPNDQKLDHNRVPLVLMCDRHATKLKVVSPENTRKFEKLPGSIEIGLLEIKEVKGEPVDRDSDSGFFDVLVLSEKDSVDSIKYQIKATSKEEHKSLLVGLKYLREHRLLNVNRGLSYNDRRESL